MLTDVEKDRLNNRDKIDPKLKARNEFIIRNKFKTWMDDSKDALLILKSLEDKQLQKMVNDEVVSALFGITEEISALMGSEEIFRNWGRAVVCRTEIDPMSMIGFTPDQPPRYIRKPIRKATEEDLAREERFEEHIKNLISISHPLPMRKMLVDIIDEKLGFNSFKKLIRELFNESLSIEGAEELLGILQKDLEDHENEKQSQYWTRPWRF